jgi:hypothetical protein
MPLGQSAFFGIIAGEIAGAVCNAFGADKDTKEAIQSLACTAVGQTVAFVTVDPVGSIIVAGESVAYAAGVNPSTAVNAINSVGSLGS